MGGNDHRQKDEKKRKESAIQLRKSNDDWRRSERIPRDLDVEMTDTAVRDGEGELELRESVRLDLDVVQIDVARGQTQAQILLVEADQEISQVLGDQPCDESFEHERSSVL